MRFLFALLLLLGPATAFADADCGGTHQACRAQCGLDHSGEDRTAGRAGCYARCAGELAMCEGQGLYREGERAYQQEVRPWLDQQADRLRQFRDGFLGRESRPGKPAPGAVDL